jgi:iron complex outermembrane receptor protein
MVATASRHWPGVTVGLGVHGNVRYFGDAYTRDYNQLVIPSRTLANMGFMYVAKIGDRAIDITGNVNNLFNKKYWGLSNIGEGINGSLSVKIYW